jgi:hypothetical protein
MTPVPIGPRLVDLARVEDQTVFAVTADDLQTNR